MFNFSTKPLFYSDSGLVRDPLDRKAFDGFSTESWRETAAHWQLYWQGKSLFVGGQALLLERFERAPTVLLGRHEGRQIFALDLSDWGDADALRFAEQYSAEWADLRRYGPALEAGLAARLAYGRGMAHWHQRTQFCGVCGSSTLSAEGGHVRRCTSASCGISHFPRTDPAVIMLVTDDTGPEPRVLLGRQAVWPAGMMSTLAGFVEPGESLEEAVRREVWEEVGVRIGDVTYCASQPWPFPASLMIGFRARALTFDITVDPSEIESARWFTQRELQDPEIAQHVAPRPDSIARRLIEDWLSDAAAAR
jgi:NAD+ diphosphatase